MKRVYLFELSRSDGLGMCGSASRKSMRGVFVCTMASLSDTSPASTEYKPCSAWTPSVRAWERRRRSLSTMSVRTPEVAIAQARFAAMNVFPSLGTALVITTVRMGLSTLMKRIFASSVFAEFSTLRRAFSVIGVFFFFRRIAGALLEL